MPERGTGAQPRVSQAKAKLLRVLGHPARVSILELLRDGERTVGDLQQALGLEASSTSQHLSALKGLDVLESRREGTNVYYRIKDPRTTDLLDTARKIITTSLEDSQSLLAQLTDREATED